MNKLDYRLATTFAGEGMGHDISYGRRQSARWPWSSRYQKLSASEVPSLLASGEELSVKAADQDSYLPLRSTQDFLEVESFRSGQVRADLEEPELARKLMKLQQENLDFVSPLEGKRRFQ